MSFILDALRKSETDRRRTATPMLAGIPVEVSRTVVPAWMWAVIVVLGIAVIGLGGAWWSSQRQPAQSGEPTAAVVVVPSVEAVATPRNTGPDVFDGGEARVAADAEPGPPAAAASRLSAAPDSQTQDRPVVPATSTAATTEPGRSEPATTPMPVVTAPRPQESRASAVLPTIQEMRAAGVSIPELNLELHVYHSEPAARWVYINGSRYTEGRSLAAGPTLTEIVPEGVVLDYDGREFLLLAQ